MAKNKRLNSIHVVVSLLREQIHSMGVVSGRPTSSNSAAQAEGADSNDNDDDSLLIFSSGGLSQLQKRTEELKSERAMQKNKFREDRQAYFNLQSECKELKTKIESLDKQCSVEMIKRFGESVTMADIESFAVNRTLEEMKEISRRKEQSLYKRIKGVEVNNTFQKPTSRHLV